MQHTIRGIPAADEQKRDSERRSATPIIPRMRRLLVVNRWAIALFGLSSGMFKLIGGAADVELFARVGLSPGAVAVFGAFQMAAAAAVMWRPGRRPGAVLLACCNAFATYGLFVAGVQPFGYISLAFVGMAALVAYAPE